MTRRVGVAIQSHQASRPRDVAKSGQLDTVGSSPPPLDHGLVSDADGGCHEAKSEHFIVSCGRRSTSENPVLTSQIRSPKPWHQALSTSSMIPTCTPTTKRWVYITSDAFKSKMQPARHRMVYALLKDEMAAVGGIHALQLRTKTVDEEARSQAKEEGPAS
nr:putative bola-like protein [Quercus suber]